MMVLLMADTSVASNISDAAKTHTYVFVAYAISIILTAAMSWWLWSSGNRVQEAVKADADARIAEARGIAATANAGQAKANATAATANEKAEALKGENLALQKQVAILEKDAADAKAAQLRIQADIDDARAKTAIANKEAAKANEGLAKANLSIEDRKKENLQLTIQLEAEREARNNLVKAMRVRRISWDVFIRLKVDDFPDSPAMRDFDTRRKIKVMLVTARDPESMWAAWTLGTMVEMLDWAIVDFKQDDHLRPGIVVEAAAGPVDPGDHRNEAREVLLGALKASGVAAKSMPGLELPPNTLRICVGTSDILTAQQLTISTDGKVEKVINPLIDFKFEDLPPFRSLPQPAPKQKADGKSAEPPKPKDSQ
jgi:hypothetical protein